MRQPGRNRPRELVATPSLLARKLGNFVDLDQVALDLLDRVVARSRIVPANTDLISEGDKPGNVHLVLRGFACRYKLLENGTRQIVAYLVPGDLCDLHVFLLDHMDHSVSTLSECEVVDIPRATILAMLDRPDIARGLLLSTMVDEGTLREWLASVGRRSAEERVAHLLCELLARLRSVGLASEDTFPLPVTQVELADTTGMTAVHVNRIIQRLRREKLISLGGKELVVLDVAGLQKLAGWNPNYLHLRRQSPSPS
jgi:CRP-like cAMP-binding protein